MENIKYIGGLNVALCFKDQANAARFMIDTSIWIEWLQWVVPGNSRDFCDERIAWVNIIGLPMRLWSDGNVTSIVKNFGRIIVPADEMGAKVDESILKVGILTKLKKWINAEIAVNDGGKHFNVGLVEFEKNWTPLSNNSFVDSESSDDEEGGDEDGISDTDMALEDGEIPPENDRDDNKKESVDGDGRGDESFEIPATIEVPTYSKPFIPMPKCNNEDEARGANSNMGNKVKGTFHYNNKGTTLDYVLDGIVPVGPFFPTINFGHVPSTLPSYLPPLHPSPIR